RCILVALERERQRTALERVAGKVVRPAQQRTKYADQPHIPVGVVEYQRDRMLAFFSVVRSRLIELLKQRSDQLFLQEIRRILGEGDFLIRGGIVVASKADDPNEGEHYSQPYNTFCSHVAHIYSSQFLFVVRWLC